MKQILTIANMSCQNCVKHVTNHLSEMEHVSDVVVDLETKTATVTTDTAYSLADYQASLDDTVYEVTAVQ